MKVAIIGASGNIGSAIRDEALSRGHQVTAIVRNPEKITIQNEALTVVKGDVLEGRVDELVKGNDAVISSYNPGWGLEEMHDITIEAYDSIISGAKKAGIRLLVVGGAGSLEASPGVQVIDTMDVPPNIKGAILGLREVLYTLRKETGLDWTFLSPAANIASGERTGKFRLGKEQLVKDEAGESKISTQDYAIAMIDELEKPQHSGQRFTLAY
ncbi:MAG: NAD(P)-dependent oxidoreductase [Dehalococcoidales bacterium]